MIPLNFKEPEKAGRSLYDSNGVLIGYDMSQEETNENNNVVKPAKLRKENQLEAYAATINYSFYLFIVHCLEVFGICSELFHELNKLSCKQRRIWSGIYFMGSGQGKKLVQKFENSGWSLGEISNLTEKIPVEKMYQQYMRGIVTAADAEMLDIIFGPSFPPPTNRIFDYNWEALRL